MTTDEPARISGRLSIGFASVAGICGVAAAVQVGSLLRATVSPSQLPGYAKAVGIDPSADLLRLLLLLLLPTLAALGVRGFRAIHSMEVTGVGLATVVAGSTVASSSLAGPAAGLGWSPLWTMPMVLLLAVAEAFWIGRGSFERGAGNFTWSTLMLPFALWGSRPTSISWLAGFSALALPAVMSIWRDPLENKKGLRHWVAVLVLLPGSVVALGAATCLRLPPIADIFEDGHGLLPASEYLRGEKPFQDIVPGHGLLSDGGMQVVSLRLFGDDYRGLGRGSKVVGALFWPAVYLVGLGASGSASVGFWALLISFLWFPQYTFFRVIASLLVLALASAAARTGRRGLWIAAGAALPPAVLSAVDFAGFAAAGCITAILVSRRGWRASLTGFALGLLPSTGAASALLAFGGVFPWFLTSTFRDLRGLLPVYALGFHAGSAEVREWLAGWGFLSNKEFYFGAVLLGCPVFLAILAARYPRIGPRTRALAPILAWFVAGTVSVIERHHVGYPAFVLPITVVLASRWIVGQSPWDSKRGILAISMLATLVWCARPLELAGAVADSLQTLRIPPGFMEVRSPRRARGALFSPAQRNLICRTDEFLNGGLLGPSDTWLDFANAPGLYYLFNRDCPIRYYEVPFYETLAAQREVIGAIRINGRVRAVLFRTGLPSDAIDGIPNSQRAPLVFRYLEREFHPAFAKDGVEFWIRIGPLSKATTRLSRRDVYGIEKCRSIRVVPPSLAVTVTVRRWGPAGNFGIANM